MPPQGESTGFAIEDAVLVSRVFDRFSQKDLSHIFEVYEKTRRPRINKAYKEAVWRWGQIKDKLAYAEGYRVVCLGIFMVYGRVRSQRDI
jgi:2-polyprenyl-6-methoxyphenol hydroxylase-like FAD-dependent oxidoreductase